MCGISQIYKMDRIYFGFGTMFVYCITYNRINKKTLHRLLFLEMIYFCIMNKQEDMTEIKKILQQNRSYRRYDASVKVSEETLVQLVEVTRYVASARNMQPLRYVLCNEDKLNDQLFAFLAWAGYLKDWSGPAVNERPSAYIIVCKEVELADAHTLFDAGLAVQSILLRATEEGLGGCIIGAFNKLKVKELLNISDRYDLLYVIAVGKPSETIVLEDMKDNIKYWRDENDIHHVPKRKLNDLIINR